MSVLYLQEETMFLLTKIPKAFLVVENYSEKVSMDIKKEILEEMQLIANDLKIDTQGYSHRALGVMIYDTAIDDRMILNIDLVLGEEVKRIDDGKEVYGLTYEKRQQFLLDDKSDDEIEELLMEKVYLLLGEFKEQYSEDNL